MKTLPATLCLPENVASAVRRVVVPSPLVVRQQQLRLLLLLPPPPRPPQLLCSSRSSWRSTAHRSGPVPPQRRQPFRCAILFALSNNVVFEIVILFRLTSTMDVAAIVTVPNAFFVGSSRNQTRVRSDMQSKKATTPKEALTGTVICCGNDVAVRDSMPMRDSALLAGDRCRSPNKC